MSVPSSPRFSLLQQHPINEAPHKPQKVILPSSGGWRSGFRVPARSGSGQNPLLGCKLPSSHCVKWQKVEKRSNFSPDSYKGSDPTHGGSTLMISSTANKVPKSSPPKTITQDSEGKRVVFRHMKLGWGITLSPHHSYDEILFSNEREQAVGTHDNMDKF